MKLTYTDVKLILMDVLSKYTSVIGVGGVNVMMDLLERVVKVIVVHNMQRCGILLSRTLVCKVCCMSWDHSRGTSKNSYGNLRLP